MWEAKIRLFARACMMDAKTGLRVGSVKVVRFLISLLWEDTSFSRRLSELTEKDSC